MRHHPRGQARRDQFRSHSVRRAGPQVLIELSRQVSLRVLLRNLIVSDGDLAWTHKRSMTTR
jgi:hypothetical protein